MKLQDIMTFCPKTIAPDATVQEAAVAMKTENVGFLPVVSGEEIVGVLTDRDIVVRGLCSDPGTKCVKDVMTSTPITIAQTARLPDAIRLMSEHKIGRLPIVDEKRHLKGIVSANDIARANSGSKQASELVQTLGKAHRATGKTASLTRV
jgi:CBS domain-containing protein